MIGEAEAQEHGERVVKPEFYGRGNALNLHPRDALKWSGGNESLRLGCREKDAAWMAEDITIIWLQ